MYINICVCEIRVGGGAYVYFNNIRAWTRLIERETLFRTIYLRPGRFSTVAAASAPAHQRLLILCSDEFDGSRRRRVSVTRGSQSDRSCLANDQRSTGVGTANVLLPPTPSSPETLFGNTNVPVLYYCTWLCVVSEYSNQEFYTKRLVEVFDFYAILPAAQVWSYPINFTWSSASGVAHST